MVAVSLIEEIPDPGDKGSIRIVSPIGNRAHVDVAWRKTGITRLTRIVIDTRIPAVKNAGLLLHNGCSVSLNRFLSTVTVSCCSQ